MKKLIFVAATLIVLIIAVVIYISSRTIDTKYAIEYSQVFGSYDIGKADKYLNEETFITHNGVTDMYKNLRSNVITAFKEKEYEMANDSSYGHGNDVFVNGIQTIGIQTYVDSAEYSSEFVSMEISRSWLVFYEVKSLSSEDDFFGYLFFGIKK